MTDKKTLKPSSRIKDLIKQLKHHEDLEHFESNVEKNKEASSNFNWKKRQMNALY